MNKYDFVPDEPRAVIAYCRVSSREQEEGLSSTQLFRQKSTS